MRDLHVLATELPHELHVVVAGHAEGIPGRDHVANHAEGVQNARPTIHEIAKKDGLSPFGMSKGSVAPDGIIAVKLKWLVAQLAEQGLQLVAAAVHVADDVERPVVVPLVVPKRGPLDDRRLDFLGRIEDENVWEPFSLQSSQGPPQLRLLLADDVSPEAAVLSPAVPLLADLLWQVEDDGHRQAVILPAKLHQRLAGLRLDVRGVNDRQLPQLPAASGR